MMVLAADTGTPYASIALCSDSTVAAETTIKLDRAHAERLLTLTESVLESAGVSLGDIDLFAIATGPGSFTGSRIGVSSWKGLALGTNKPLIGVPSLDAMSRLHPAHGVVCPMVDARMGEVFAAAYEWKGGVRNTIKPPCVMSGEKFAGEMNGPFTLYGDGAEKYAGEIKAAAPQVQFLNHEDGIPRAWAVAEEAEFLLESGATADAAMVEPIYLRKSQAELAKEKAR